MQPIYAVANAICSFIGETKETQPEQPPEIFFTLVNPGLFIYEDVRT